MSFTASLGDVRFKKLEAPRTTIDWPEPDTISEWSDGASLEDSVPCDNAMEQVQWGLWVTNVWMRLLILGACAIMALILTRRFWRRTAKSDNHPQPPTSA